MSVEHVDNDPKAAVQEIPTSLKTPTSIWRSILAPIRSAFSKGLGFLRPMAPQLISMAVFLLLIPLIVFLSVFAGWIVWRNVAVGWETTLYLQYGDGIPPYAEASLPNLIPRQRYDISLHLVVPAVVTNFALGNFMTTLRLSTVSNQTLTYIRRPAIALPPTSRIPLLSSRPSLVGMEVPLLTSYAADTTQVVANVALGRVDGWRSLGSGEGREISVLSASLKGVIKHHGIRGLVARFPLISAFISAIAFFIVSSLIIAACLLPTMRRRQDIAGLDSVPLPSEADDKYPLPGWKDDDDGASSDDEKRRKRRKRSRRRKSRSASQKTDIQAEVPPTTIIPPEDPKTTPMRRRLSRSEDLAGSEK